MAVLEPLKVVIENYEGDGELVESENLPKNEQAGTRQVRFSREIYIERADFMEEPPPKFFRLAPGKEVRLKDAYIIKCESVVKDADGNVTELICTYDPGSKTGGPTAGRKVKGTLHWVDAATAIPCEARLYDYLLTEGSEGDFTTRMNPDSLKVMPSALIERAGADARGGREVPVPASGLFLQRPGQQRKLSGVQFDRELKRQLPAAGKVTEVLFKKAYYTRALPSFSRFFS